MKAEKLYRGLKQPCPKCPYTLGQVKTLANPCPQCKLNGYNMYEQFMKQMTGEK